MTGKYLIIWIVAVGLLCVGCLREEEEAFSQVRGAIVGGNPASSPEDAVAVALAVRLEESTLAFCSGALIAPDVVLTAAHCVDSSSEFSFEAIWNRGLVRVVAGESLDAEDAAHYEVLRYVIHPAFNPEAARHDLAILWLDRPVADAYVYPILEDTASVTQMAKDHHAVRFLGYGLDEEGREGRRLEVSGAVSGICTRKQTLQEEGCMVKLESGTYLLPYGTFMHSIEQGGPCQGDSGGPVLAQWKGETYLVGIVLGGDGGCRLIGVTTLLALRSNWIQEKLYGDDGSSDCHAGNLRATRPAGRRTGFVPWLAVILLALVRGSSTLWPRRVRK